MATSKTLAPTNVTISIPAMTDQPNASVLANCADKEADAINALNSQLVKDFGSKTVSDFESALVTLGNSLGAGGVAHFTVAFSNASGVFTAASYVGFVEKITTNRLTVILSRNVVNQTVCGRYNGSWAWDEYALGSMMVTEELTYSSTDSYFPVTGTPKNGVQICVLGRNISSGAIYALWYSHTQRAFRIGATLTGNAPSNGDKVVVQYLA